MSPEVQVIFSTLSTPDLFTIQPFSRNFLHISLEPETILLQDVKHFCIVVEYQKLKFDFVNSVYNTIKDDYPILIFCNTYRELDRLVVRLSDFSIPAMTLKSEMNENEF